jgi:hypothetical protein
MEPTSVTTSPFAALTLVAAPALLTNATSVLAMSTINRMLRTRDRMTQLLKESEAGGQSQLAAVHLLAMVNRVEAQAAFLLRALHSIYVGLGAFASATLVTLLGAGAAFFIGEFWLRVMGWIGIGLGIVGVGGLILGSANLFYATRLTLINIREEGTIIRERLAAFKKAADQDDHQRN